MSEKDDNSGRQFEEFIDEMLCPKPKEKEKKDDE
jgi:hypothetical protein